MRLGSDIGSNKNPRVSVAPAGVQLIPSQPGRIYLLFRHRNATFNEFTNNLIKSACVLAWEQQNKLLS